MSGNENADKNAALAGPIASNVQGTQDTEAANLLSVKRDLLAQEEIEAADAVQGKLSDRVMRDLNEMDRDYKSMK
jgi:hypothetical protein